MIYSTFVGDTTIPSVVIAGVNTQGTAVAVTEPGWVCRAQLLNADRQRVTAERVVTEIVDVNGVNHFVASMLPAESEKMVADYRNRVPQKHYFSVELENLLIDYRHTIELELSVLPKP